MLWVDEARPKKLKELDLHHDVNNILMRLAGTSDFPHLLFYGPPGSGRKTRIMAFLHDIFGAGVGKLKSDMKQFTVNKTDVEICMLSSSYHFEFNPSDAGVRDRHVVQDFIKEIAENPQTAAAPGKPRFKVIILNEADKLTTAAQQALRRTMEAYVKHCRLILVCDSLSRVIEPLRSRCLLIRVPAASHEQMEGLLHTQTAMHQINANGQAITRIADFADGNMRLGLLLLEATAVRHNMAFTPDTMPVGPNWIAAAESIGSDIVDKPHTPQTLQSLRTKTYELLARVIPAERVFSIVLNRLLTHRQTPPAARGELVYYGAFYEHRCALGGKPIVHLEAFYARAMSVLANNGK